MLDDPILIDIQTIKYLVIRFFTILYLFLQKLDKIGHRLLYIFHKLLPIDFHLCLVIPLQQFLSLLYLLLSNPGIIFPCHLVYFGSLSLLVIFQRIFWLNHCSQKIEVSHVHFRPENIKIPDNFHRIQIFLIYRETI